MTAFVFIGSGGGGAASSDHFAPAYIVGNVPAGDPAVAQTGTFRYIPDVGDGSGIAQALAEAALVPGDVFIRRGSYDFGQPASPSMPLTIPAGVRVRGAASGVVAAAGEATWIVGPREVTQRVFVLAHDASLEDMVIESLAPSSAVTDTEQGVLSTAQDAQGVPAFRRLHVMLRWGGDASPRLQTCAIFANRSVPVIDSCVLEGYDSGEGSRESDPSIGVLCGEIRAAGDGGTFFVGPGDPVVRSTIIDGFNVGVRFSNMAGGQVDGCQITRVRWNAGVDYVTSLNVDPAGAGSARLPTVSKVEIDFPLDSPGDPGERQVGVRIRPSVVDHNDTFFGLLASDVRVVFEPQGGVPGDADRIGMSIEAGASEDAGARVLGGAVVNVYVIGSFQYGLLVAAEGGDQVPGEIRKVRFANFVAPYADSGSYGVSLEAKGGGVVDSIGFANCDFSDHAGGGGGILIGTGVTRTTIVGCSLFGTGTDVTDNGTGTEMGHNQLT